MKKRETLNYVRTTSLPLDEDAREFFEQKSKSWEVKKQTNKQGAWLAFDEEKKRGSVECFLVTLEFLQQVKT